jgi:WD40 repeat protein
LNTRINGAHDGEVNSVTFIGLGSTLGIVTCGNEGKAKLWHLGGSGDNEKGRSQRWDPVRTFSHIGQIPRCADSSRDQSVIAIGFDSLITLWSTKMLSLISTLSTVTCGSEFYTSLAFGPGNILMASNKTSIHVWSLLNNQLTHKMSLGEPRLIRCQY